MTKLTVPARGEVSESFNRFSNNTYNKSGFVSNLVKSVKRTGLLLAATTLMSSAVLVSCDTDDAPMTSNLKLNITGLENLGTNYVYEGWLMVNGSPITSGRFSVNDAGVLSQNMFAIDAEKLSAATAFILTIEPAVGDDPAPSDVHILAGDFSGNSGMMKVSDAKALGNDFMDIAGKYILATPTNSDPNDEYSGVWFLDNSSGSPAAGLNLPTLPAGWQYEGWVVVNGKPVTTGTFTSVTGADMFNGYSGSLANPPFPGEDLLQNAPTGLTFPVDIRGGKVAISIEPIPDNSPAPFLLKPLLADVPANAEVHKVQTLGKNIAGFPSGTFSR